MTRPSRLRRTLSPGSAELPLVVPLALVALGSLTAVFFRLGARGLWGDEVWQVSWSQQQPWLETFLRFRAPPDLPLSFLLTKAAVAFGEEPFLARLPSAAVAAVAPIVTFFFARRLFGTQTGTTAALLLAIAPLHVWYGQDARPYAALSLYALASLVLFWRLLERPTVLNTLGLGAATILGLYNHVFGAFPLAIEFVFFAAWAVIVWLRSPPAIGRERRSRVVRAGIGMACVGAAAVVTTLPLLEGVLSYLGRGGPGEVEAPPFVPSVDFLETLLGGFGAGTGPLFWAVLGLFALGTVGALRRGHPFPALALVWLVLPIAALWVAQPRHIFIPRYFLFMQPVYLILVGHGLVVAGSALHRAVRGRSAAAARVSIALVTATVLLAFAIPTASSYWTSRGTDWTAMCSYLKAHVAPGDVIVGNAYHQGVMGWCLRETPAAAVAPTGSYDIKALATSGRGAWYVFVPYEQPDPVLAALGYVVVSAEEWGAVEAAGPASAFSFPVGEYGAVLYRHQPLRLPRALSFHEVNGASISPNWPDYAQLGPGGRYQVRLSLPAQAPRALEVLYLDAVGRDLEVYVDGILASRLVGGLGQGGWMSATIPVPMSLGDVLLVEFRNPGTELAAFSRVEVRYRAAHTAMDAAAVEPMTWVGTKTMPTKA